ncbi:MAG: hypothetical protein HYW45_01945 [Candidatus Daviesbacteria bacterium]|nr:MAG: hypothetical protein HYW45_01945 [Candidatus Daviesbacteria bacterium]
MKLAAVEDVFGKITPPLPLQPFVEKDPTGAGGISLFLSNLIILIYEIAAVIFVFMLVWGAFEWIMSGGNKDAIGNARGRITHAIIGIILLGITFAILNLVGIFTGFTFFKT